MYIYETFFVVIQGKRVLVWHPIEAITSFISTSIQLNIDNSLSQ